MTREVIFVLLPKVVLLDMAGPADAFRNAAALVPGSYALRFVAPRATIQTAVGLSLAGLEPLPARVAPGSLLVLTGISGEGIDPHEPATRDVIWLRSGVDRQMQLLAWRGSVLAARAGLSQGAGAPPITCTSRLRRVEPRARYRRPHFRGGRRGVSPAPTSPPGSTWRYLIGPARAAGGCGGGARPGRGLSRAGTDPALAWVMHRNHLHPAVHCVQDAVARDPAVSWSSSQLSAVACTSARNLARLFAEHAGCSPLDYVQLIRFAFAKQLVTGSRLDLERVAARAGFRSAQHLRRVWSRWETRPPSAFRARPSHAA
jgi:transcriptional regulator GlxA family with amidase domain